MKAGFYAGAAGLLAQQAAMDNIGNNLANVNTAGYKSQEVGFQDLLYNHMYVNTDQQPLKGSGVRAVDLGVDFSQGMFNSTGFAFDFAIEGEGMFALDHNGTREYTRAGVFDVGLVDGVPYLTDVRGAFVLDRAGNRIQIPRDENGNMVTGGLADLIGVYTVDRTSAMTPLSQNAYGVNESTGAARLADEDGYVLRQGVLELSNVSMEDEMTRMIMAQRAFQLSARVVQTEDEIEQNVNSLRG